MQKINGLINPDEKGVLAQLQGLHEVVFIQGSGFIKVIYFVWFLFALLIELIPLMVKKSNKRHFVAYLEEEQRQVGLTKAMNRFKESVEINQEKQIINTKKELETKKELLEHSLTIEDEMEQIKRDHDEKKLLRDLEKHTLEEDINQRIFTATDEEGHKKWQKSRNGQYKPE